MRKLIFCFLCLIVIAAPLTAFGQTGDVPLMRAVRPNLVGGELGGRAILYSLNYERFVTPKVGIGAGLMGIGVSEGGVFLIPLYVSFTPIGNVHSLYLSGGYTIAGAAADEWGTVESTGFGTAAIGYLYHSEGGFYVKPTITLLFIEDNFLALPGIALGGSF